MTQDQDRIKAQMDREFIQRKANLSADTLAAVAKSPFRERIEAMPEWPEWEASMQRDIRAAGRLMGAATEVRSDS